jgi:hypothetical protein
MRPAAALIVVFSVLGAHTRAQSSWLPAAVAEGVADGFASQLSDAGIGGSEEERLAKGREVVALLRDRLDELDVEGVLIQAPVLADLALPATGNRYLDTMARIQVCAVFPLLALQESALPPDADVHIVAAMSLMTVTMAVLRLREPFIGAGGTPESMERFLSGSALEPAIERVQTDTTVGERARRECGQFVTSILG